MPLDDAAMTLTPAIRLSRVVVVANTASGSVGPKAPETARGILSSFGLDAEIFAPDDKNDIGDCLDKAFATAPDLVIVLAGDGTARAAAERAGPKGPLIAPLPGGTMNMLPHAVYGVVSWEQALHDALERGVAKPIGGGAIDGKLFFVAAILGGMVSYPLAAAGALLVGLLESFSSFWWSAFKESIVFTLIIPVLLWRSLTTRHVEEEEE